MARLTRSSRHLWILVGAVLAGLLVLPAPAGTVASPAPPVVTGPEDPTNEPDASFEFTGEPDATFECSLDASTYAACVSGQTSYPALEEGAHEFKVRAVSPSGVSEPASHSWYLDLTLPVLPSNSTTEATSAAGAIVAFAATDDHALDTSDCQPASGTTFPLGTTMVHCTAQDLAGNSNSGDFFVTVQDTTAPTLGLHADQIAPQDHAGGAHVTFDPALSAQDSVDAAPAVSCDHESGSAFPFGETLVTCTAADGAGNVSLPATFTVTVQPGAVPEAPTIAVAPQSLTNAATAHFEFSTSADVSVRCRLDEGAFTDCSASQDYADLTEGAHTFTIQVQNDIENMNEISYDWTVDLTKPTDVTGFSALARPGKVTLSFVVPSDADFDRVRLQRRRAGTNRWKTVAEVAGPAYKDTGVVNEVSYRYRAVAIDEAGNLSDARFASARPSKVFAPQYRARVGAPVLIDWVSSRNATYYNLQLWRGGRKILSVWPSGSRYVLSSRWTFGGQSYRLNRDRHNVYVWPGFGSRAVAKYGGLLGTTTFFGK